MKSLKIICYVILISLEAHTNLHASETNRQIINVHELLSKNPPQHNAYLDSTDVSDIKRIIADRAEILDYQNSGRKIFYDVLTVKLRDQDKKKFQQPTFDYLKGKILLGEKYLNYAEIDTADPEFFKAVGSYWLNYMCEILADTIRNNRSIIYKPEITYLLKRLEDDKFYPTYSPISNFEKIVYSVCQHHWTYLAQRFNAYSTTGMKIFLVFSIAVYCIGLYTFLRWLFLKIAGRILKK